MTMRSDERVRKVYENPKKPADYGTLFLIVMIALLLAVTYFYG